MDVSRREFIEFAIKWGMVPLPLALHLIRAKVQEDKLSRYDGLLLRKLARQAIEQFRNDEEYKTAGPDTWNYLLKRASELYKNREYLAAFKVIHFRS